MTVGEIIKRYRVQNRLSQREFAARCGDITSGYISMLERGVNPYSGKPIVPSIDKLSLIAQAMNMTLHQLIEMAEDMTVYIGTDDSSDGDEAPAAPRTPEARIVSGWMDNLPEWQRKFLEDLVASAIANFPKG